MVCRRCQRQFEDKGKGVCPFCGEAYSPVTSGIMKTSTIVISAGQTDAVYRSVSEVPQPLRKRLLKSTSGMNSATILIADRRGKEELAKAIRRLPGNAQQKLLDVVMGQASDSSITRYLKPYRRTAAAAALVVLTSAFLWFAFNHKW
jgi:hypothetical protein